MLRNTFRNVMNLQCPGCSLGSMGSTSIIAEDTGLMGLC